MVWDIFCKVIDNHGDLGVCWRLCQNLAAQGKQLRLWVDELSALAWMAPDACERIDVQVWATSTAWPEPGDVVVEAFGCELPPELVARMAQRHLTRPIAWINLEYLSAEPYAEQCHSLPSPVFHGPGAGLTKHFFYPGFTPGTGGLLREPDLATRQARFERGAWLAQMGILTQPHSSVRYVSLFCYEPTALTELLTQLAQAPHPTHLLVTAGRATAAVKAAINNENGHTSTTGKHSKLSISYLSHLSQLDFDHLLWACDVNFVRGEDSLVRAIWAGKPFVWHIYPQDDNAHHAKLEALLDTLDAPPTLRTWHHIWNGLSDGPLPTLEALQQDTSVPQARVRLQQQADLSAQLQAFVTGLAAKAR